MKKLIVLIVLLFTPTVFADLNPYIADYRAAGGGAACTATDAGECENAGTADYAFGHTTNEMAATELVATATVDVCQIDVDIKKVGTPSGNATLHIYSDDGGTPQGNHPNASLGESTNSFAAGDLLTTYTTKSFTFSPAISISSGTRYWIVFDSSSVSGTDYFEASRAADCNNDQEHLEYYDAGAWNQGTLSNAISPIEIYGE